MCDVINLSHCLVCHHRCSRSVFLARLPDVDTAAGVALRFFTPAMAKQSAPPSVHCAFRPTLL